jgi:glycosyltransferase involved in cell wall biosynthesis
MSKLKIAVDFPWDASACMGTGAYSETMVRALAKAAPEAEIVLVVSKDAPRSVRLPNVRYESLLSVDALREGPRQLGLPALLLEMKADCLFAPATLLPVMKVCPAVATVHDLSFVRKPEHYAPGLLRYLEEWFDPSLRAAEHLVAISEEAKEELASLKGVSPEKVTVVRQPVRETFLRLLGPGEQKRLLAELGVEGPFFFHVSNLGPHKNVQFALEAFAGFLAARPDSPHTLVIAGGGYAPNRPPDFLAMARDLGLEGRVRYAGKVGDESLKALYQGCDAFLFPSLAEGWGLPVAEAGTLGACVLASPHVPAALDRDRIPLDPALWVKALVDPGERRAPYTPPDFETAGRELYKVLLRVAGRAVAKRRREIPRVAMRGDWRSPSGLGQAARNTFQALRAAGLDPVPVLVEKDSIQDPRLWTDEVRTDVAEAEVWVHHVPPSHFDLSLPGRHVALFCWETDRIPAEWVVPLNGLDEIWVPAPFLEGVLASSGLRTNVATCPIAVDTDLYSPGPRRPPRVHLPQGFDTTWTVFLYTGTWDPRKRPDVLVRAFCKSFGANDRALLLLKSYVTGNPAQDRAILADWLSQCRTGGAHVELMADVLAPAEMVELFRFATVFATASRGEGYCLPAAQAMSCGKPVLAADWSALADLVSIPVKYTLENVPREVRLPAYDASHCWAAIDEEDLARQLEWAHSHRPELVRLGHAARERILRTASLPAVGRFLASRLEDLCSSKTPALEAAS